MDGGKDPALEPATNGYIAFENGVKGFFIGGSKKTPTNIKMEVEIVGDSGRLVIDNAGDVSGRRCALRRVKSAKMPEPSVRAGPRRERRVDGDVSRVRLALEADADGRRRVAPRPGGRDGGAD